MTQPDARVILDALLAGEEGAVLLVVQGDRIALASAAARRLLGGAAPGDALAPLFHGTCREKLAAALACETAAAWELQVEAGSGAPRVVTFLVLPAADGARVLLGPAGGASDGAQRREASVVVLTSELAAIARDLARKGAELEAARTRLEELVRQRDEFMSIVSHDLKSSLSAVRLQGALLDRMKGPPTDEHRKKIAGLLCRNVDRMTSLITDLLDAALADAGELRIAPGPMSLDGVADEVIDTVAPIAAEAGVALRRAGGAPGLVMADARRLYQVLLNLVENAIRHSPRGTEVLLELAPRGSSVRCAVEDSGPGVAPEERAAVFERFKRGGRNAGRAGLGLYIAHQIVNLHGGAIWVETGARGGARFVFEIPSTGGVPLVL